jgi:hypothetical protein
MKTKLTTKMMMVNHVLPAGGAYCTDNNYFNAYIPKKLVNTHSLNKYDEINCVIVPNVPAMARVCPNMVLTIVGANDEVETNVISLTKRPTDIEPTTLPSPIIIEQEDDIEDVIIDNDLAEDVTVDDLSDVSTPELDEIICTALEEHQRMTYSEIFWYVTGYDKVLLKEMSEPQRAVYDRIGARCASLHREGALAAAEVKKFKLGSVAKIIYALDISDL